MFSFDEFSIICASFMHELQTGKNPQKWSVQIQKDPSQASLFSVYLSDGYITIDSPVFFKINYTKPLAFDVQNINSPYQEYDHFTSAYLGVLRQVQFTKDAQTTFSSLLMKSTISFKSSFENPSFSFATVFDILKNL